VNQYLSDAEVTVIVEQTRKELESQLIRYLCGRKEVSQASLARVLNLSRKELEQKERCADYTTFPSRMIPVIESTINRLK